MIFKRLAIKSWRKKEEWIHNCWGWGWLIDEQVDEFVIEKYIEIFKGIVYKYILILILDLLVLLDNGMIANTFIYL